MSLAVTTEHTMIAPPTDTSMPPVMITNVMPMPINATGENSTSSGMSEPALRNAGVAKASAIHSRATSTAMRAISAGVTGGEEELSPAGPLGAAAVASSSGRCSCWRPPPS